MEKEGKSIKNFGIKHIILLLLVVFALLISYKYISSTIQEGKEKAIIQEKAGMDLREKEPLNQCLNDVETSLENMIKNTRSDAMATNNSEAYITACEAENMKRTGEKGSCITTLDEINTEIQRLQNQAELEKQECYKRYK